MYVWFLYGYGLVSAFLHLQFLAWGGMDILNLLWVEKLERNVFDSIIACG
jgi:hypothetical protein